MWEDLIMASASTLGEPADVLYRIKRGLAGYVSYLAACEMNPAFSEYVLYEPILRILTARGYQVECEVECPGITHSRTGDRKRIDFVAERHSLHLALEAKWVRERSANVTRDVEKLEAFRRTYPSSFPCLCIFGRKSHVERFSMRGRLFIERGKALYADFGRTKYGCRIFQVRGPIVDSEENVPRPPDLYCGIRGTGTLDRLKAASVRSCSLPHALIKEVRRWSETLRSSRPPTTIGLATATP
jgi:hypothetical protein